LERSADVLPVACKFHRSFSVHLLNFSQPSPYENPSANVTLWVHLTVEHQAAVFTHE
jgi:hypothetical protein